MKRLVICFDGTWNAADNRSAETNVALIACAVRANTDTAGVLQSTLYLRGVGTSGLKGEVAIAGAVGLGVDENIRSGYMFLAQNYVPGDEIFLFGFSRGAFTARSLAGFIGACGLLKRQKLHDLGRAWDYYRDPVPHSPEAFIAKTNSDSHVSVRIKFLGVWDTVGALGIPMSILTSINHSRYGFHDTEPGAVLQHGCHALAIDEYRDEFVPTLWTGQSPAGVKIEQVWFAGAHSDVGGGYVTRTLADIPLVWMAQKAEADGLVLDWSCLPDRTKPQAFRAQHDSRKGLFVDHRLMPTWRQVCGRRFSVPFYERMYAPLGVDGTALPVINEAIHQSVVDRFGQQVPICKDDAIGRCEPEPYKPSNLSPLFDAGLVKSGIYVEPY